MKSNGPLMTVWVIISNTSREGHPWYITYFHMQYIHLILLHKRPIAVQDDTHIWQCTWKGTTHHYNTAHIFRHPGLIYKCTKKNSSGCRLQLTGDHFHNSALGKYQACSNTEADEALLTCSLFVPPILCNGRKNVRMFTVYNVVLTEMSALLQGHLGICVAFLIYEIIGCLKKTFEAYFMEYSVIRSYNR